MKVLTKFDRKCDSFSHLSVNETLLTFQVRNLLFDLRWFDIHHWSKFQSICQIKMNCRFKVFERFRMLRWLDCNLKVISQSKFLTLKPPLSTTCIVYMPLSFLIQTLQWWWYFGLFAIFQVLPKLLWQSHIHEVVIRHWSISTFLSW